MLYNNALFLVHREARVTTAVWQSHNVSPTCTNSRDSDWTNQTEPIEKLSFSQSTLSSDNCNGSVRTTTVH